MECLPKFASESRIILTYVCLCLCLVCARARVGHHIHPLSQRVPRQDLELQNLLALQKALDESTPIPPDVVATVTAFVNAPGKGPSTKGADDEGKK
jgi:hypothetical protein